MDRHACAIERLKARRVEAGIGGLVCHALYLCNLAAPDEQVYERSVAALSATMDTAQALDADAVIFHVGSHLGAGFDAGLEREEAQGRGWARDCGSESIRSS